MAFPASHPCRFGILAFLSASALLSMIAAPDLATADDAQVVEKARATIAASAEKAMEKLGGSRILFKVDADALREAMVTELRDNVLRILREERIPYAGFALRDGGVELRIADGKNRQRFLNKLVSETDTKSLRAGTIGITDSGDGLIRLAPKDPEFAERLRELVVQSIDMIDQRLRNVGIRADSQPDGADRIRVLVPGLKDPERVTAVFNNRPQIAIRLVDESMTVEEALKGNAPAASEVLHHFKTKDPVLVAKKILVEGSDIVDVYALRDQRTREPVAVFRFNARGTRHFAQITAENIGRPFAVVLDDEVLSSPVIREQITGGTGQISGNFTIEEANTVAMLVRAGTIPGRLSVVDQQVVAPLGTPENDRHP
jgi:preprotein translocase subunit SecD